MPAVVTEVLEEAGRILQPERYEDYCVNGLQVPGAHEVGVLASAVSAHLESFERAVEVHAQLLIVHHGLFWGAGVDRIDPILRERLKVLLDGDLALAAYHIPLDAHPELGNNALLARALGGGALEPFALHAGQAIGFVTTMPGTGVEPGGLSERICELTGHTPLVLGSGPRRIARLAIVSGAGADYLEEASATGADALLTGEAPERAMAEAHERGLHLFVAGHYATETLGIRALGERLAERFHLEHVYLDVPNPL